MWLKIKPKLKHKKPNRLWWQPDWRFIGVFLVTILLVTTGWPVFPQFYRSQAQVVQLQPQTPEARLTEGRNLYQIGQFYAAVSLWQQAARDYELQGEILNQALSLNYLSSAYQKLGEWQQAEEAISSSLRLLQNQGELNQRGLAIFAQALNTQGSLQLAQGQTQQALETWIKAESSYEKANNETGKLGSQINQAQALQSLGQYRRSKIMLVNLVEQLQKQPDSLLKADGLRSLGVALQTTGDLLGAKAVLEESWRISEQLGDKNNISANLFSIGNIAKELGQFAVAFDYYEAAINFAQTDVERAEIQLNQLSLLVKSQQWVAAGKLSQMIQSNITSLSPSRRSIYARVNLAENLLQIWQSAASPSTVSNQNIANLLVTAIQQAREIKDLRSEAYSLDELGKIYAENQQWADAKKVTEAAIEIAQKIDGDDILARTSSQLGWILQNQGNLPQAKAAYTNAYNSLQALRSDLVAINSDVQFNFTESVEPVYRELVSLLLQPNANQEDLVQAREVIEALQLAELDNFFRDACLETKPVLLDEIDPHSAVIYPIILRDRLEVILSLPDRSLRHYATPLPKGEIEGILQQFYSSLYLGYSSAERQQIAAQIYDWLIRPAEADLTRNQTQNLVFVLDGFLRSLPMAALYDGQQYLIEKYSVALSPGLQLFAEGLERKKLQALTVGLTEARQGFAALPGVEQELAEISAMVDSKVLLNQDFTRDRFQSQVNAKPFPIVHLATHGQFSSNPEETFLLTWDDRINVKDFAELFENRLEGSLNPVELLVLSACQTAAGDRQATLGLAGFALRSGARSTLATLWSVSDQSTADLMSEFYLQLTQTKLNLTKAEALRRAQLSLLKNPEYNHPYFWAPFVLVGNWL
jgi:CHAT domain-containing protein